MEYKITCKGCGKIITDHIEETGGYLERTVHKCTCGLNYVVWETGEAVWERQTEEKIQEEIIRLYRETPEEVQEQFNKLHGRTEQAEGYAELFINAMCKDTAAVETIALTGKKILEKAKKMQKTAEDSHKEERHGDS